MTAAPQYSIAAGTTNAAKSERCCSTLGCPSSGGHRASDHTAHTANKTNTAPSNSGALRTTTGRNRAGRNADATAGITARVRPIGTPSTKPEFDTSMSTVGVPSACSPRKPAAMRNDRPTRNKRASSWRRASSAALIASAELMSAVTSTSQKCGPWCCHMRSWSTCGRRVSTQRPISGSATCTNHTNGRAGKCRAAMSSHHSTPQRVRPSVMLVCCGPTGRFSAPDQCSESILEERNVDAAEDPVDRRALGDELEATGDDPGDACCGRRRRRSRARGRRGAPASSVSCVHVTFGPKSLLRSSERISSSRLVCSSHAAPLIADSAMRCSVPSMPLPCGNGSAGASQGAT